MAYWSGNYALDQALTPALFHRKRRCAMKWFFLKIWAGIVAFVSLIVRVSVSLICGRMVRDVDIAEEIGVASAAPSPPPPPKTPWIPELAFVIFERVVATGLRQLVIYPGRRLDADELSNLTVEAEFSVRGPDQPQTVLFSVTAARTQRQADGKYLLTLEPLGEKNVLAARGIKEVEIKAYFKAANIRTLKLSQGGQNRLFFDSGEGYYFCDCSLPRRQRAGCG